MSKTCLLTGANGFLGKVIDGIIAREYRVLRLGRSGNHEYSVDLASTIPNFKERIDIVIHAAGKAHHIPKTEKEEQEFFQVNVVGTRNLLQGLVTSGTIPEAIVFVSSVAVYGREEGEMIKESHPLDGKTSYAMSKIMAEEVLAAWCSKSNVTLTILRLPLLVGAGAPGNLGDMVRMMRKGWYAGIGNGKARKSMVLAEDVAGFIPVVVSKGGVYNLTDGYQPSMIEFEQAVATRLRKSKPIRLPGIVLRLVARIGDFLGNRFPLNSSRLAKLTSSLTFSDEQAREQAGWKSRSVIHHLPETL